MDRTTWGGTDGPTHDEMEGCNPWLAHMLWWIKVCVGCIVEDHEASRT